MSKVCAKKIRETKDAYLLLFSFNDNNFDRTQLREVYHEIIDKFNWEIWLPKKICTTLSHRNGFYMIDDDYYYKLEKRIELNTYGTKIQTFKFSTYRKLFTNVKLTEDARRKYNSYLQRSLDEENYNRHIYENHHWTNFLI